MIRKILCNELFSVDERIFNLCDRKAGVTVKTLKGSSILSVNSVTRRDQGNYSCVASNTNPATVSVHVVQSELIFIDLIKYC